MKNHITRREAAAALLGATPVLPAAAQQPAKPTLDPLEQARKDRQDINAGLAGFKLEMSVEPAFIFKP